MISSTVLFVQGLLFLIIGTRGTVKDSHVMASILGVSNWAIGVLIVGIVLVCVIYLLFKIAYVSR